MDGVFIMVVLIVLIACGAGVLNNYLKTQRAMARSGPSEEVQAEIDRLRERVEVLEKIVTDEKYQLSKELDRLEGSPRA